MNIAIKIGHILAHFQLDIDLSWSVSLEVLTNKNSVYNAFKHILYAHRMFLWHEKMLMKTRGQRKVQYSPLVADIINGSAAISHLPQIQWGIRNEKIGGMFFSNGEECLCYGQGILCGGITCDRTWMSWIEGFKKMLKISKNKSKFRLPFLNFREANALNPSVLPGL